MATTLVKHLTKLTAMLLVLAAIAASAFIQEVHVGKLRGDAAALKILTRRYNPPPTGDAALRAKAEEWLAEADPAAAASNQAARLVLVKALKDSGVDERAIGGVKGAAGGAERAARWSLVEIEERTGEDEGADSLPVEPDSVADAVLKFVSVHRPCVLKVATEVTPPAEPGWTKRGVGPLASVLFVDRVVEVAFARDPREQFLDFEPVKFPVPTKYARITCDSRADLAYGPSGPASELLADAKRRERLTRVYGDLPLADAQATVARAITARFNAVSLLGVQVPAEYFAVALAGGLATVMFGLVAALRKARSSGSVPLDFMQSDSISALLLAKGLGRMILWLVIPVAAAVAVWPDSWLDRTWFNVYRGEIGVVAALGMWAVGLGRAVTAKAQ